MKQWMMETIGAVVGALVLIWMFSGCASTHNKPSPAGVTARQSAVVVGQHVESARQNIESASIAAKQAGQDNTQLKNLLDRIERKQVIIDRWLETQQP